MATGNRNVNGSGAHALGRALILIYGVVVYVLFLGIFVYLIGFVGGMGVPKTINDGAPGGTVSAIATNVGLLALFAIQHTIMARPAFKRWWTRYIPAAIERSTFVLFTVVILIAMVAAWRPLPEIVWQAEGVAAVLLEAAFWLGWGIVLLATFLIDHFDLFGLKQAIAAGLGRGQTPVVFRERLLYRYTRHPLMLGFVIAFWAAPTMTEGRLLFAVVTTVYILLAIEIEEKTLIELHGDAYEDYRRRVSKLIPRPPRA